MTNGHGLTLKIKLVNKSQFQCKAGSFRPVPGYRCDRLSRYCLSLRQGKYLLVVVIVGVIGVDLAQLKFHA